MSLNLNFRIEDRGGVMVVVTSDTSSGGLETVRPATSAEVELWNQANKRQTVPYRESYLRVNEQDLLGILMERDQLRKQLSVLEKDNKELRTALASVAGKLLEE